MQICLGSFPSVANHQIHQITPGHGHAHRWRSESHLRRWLLGQFGPCFLNRKDFNKMVEQPKKPDRKVIRDYFGMILLCFTFPETFPYILGVNICPAARQRPTNWDGSKRLKYHSRYSHTIHKSQFF